MTLFAFKPGDEEVNKWLGENPAIFGMLFLVIAFLTAALGVHALLTGKNWGPYGQRVSGKEAKNYGIVQLVSAFFIFLFGLFNVMKAFFSWLFPY